MSQRQRGTTARAHQGGELHGAGIYPDRLVPAVRPGDYVRLEPSGDTFVIDTMVAQPGFKIFDSDDSNGVSVSGNSTSSDNEATDMEMPDGWLGQFRPLQPGDDITGSMEVRIDLGGKQAPFYTNKNKQGEYTQDTLTPIGHDGSSTVTDGVGQLQLAELYIHEDEVPFFTFQNTTSGSETISDWYWSGFQYRLNEVSVPNDAHVEPIPTERVRD